MPDVDDLIWIEDAAKEYGRSRPWLKEQVDAGKLSYATIPGDKRLYLLRSELEKFLRPQVERKPADRAEDAG